ncbi:MAG: hypothetical protein RIA64_13750 [Rhodospirillales bacterium]
MATQIQASTQANISLEMLKILGPVMNGWIMRSSGLGSGTLGGPAPRLL